MEVLEGWIGGVILVFLLAAGTVSIDTIKKQEPRITKMIKMPTLILKNRTRKLDLNLLSNELLNLSPPKER